MAKNKTQNNTEFKKTNLKCIDSDCGGDLYRFQTGKKIGFDILYFTCEKCDDMTYYFYYGDTYDREMFELSDYQSFLKSVDVEILSMKRREKRLNDRERDLIRREQELENKGIRGLLRRIFKKEKRDKYFDLY